MYFARMGCVIPGKRANPAVFGKNVKAFRDLREWSLRELASKSRLSTRTLVKIEKGLGCTVKTELKVALGLNVYVGRLWDESLLSCGPEKVISQSDGRWFFANVDDATQYHSRARRSPSEVTDNRLRSDPDEIQDASERNRLGRAGLSRAFVRTCGGAITAGHFQLNEGEIFGYDFTPADEFGYPYLLICTDGVLKFSIGGRTHVLQARESIVFQGNEAYGVEPCPSLTRDELPSRFFFVCLRVLTTSTTGLPKVTVNPNSATRP